MRKLPRMSSPLENGTTGRRVRVSPRPIDPGALITEVTGAESGAIALFLGTVRDHSPGREGITHLEYEAYQTQVEAKIEEVVKEADSRWQINRMVVEHRVGRVDLTEISVAVAVACGHREEAFAAARYLIDELKARAPIWKKEVWPEGEAWSPGA
ncbi:MAG: molybdenum cofactor biosynthesis protein MoaE [Acidimicrobiia bacterium]|nr:molybdenum cofactor biosynthesis protein MoaE [Acidimicrobiia bacterium]